MGSTQSEAQYNAIENIIIEDNANDSDDNYPVYLEAIRKEIGWSLSIRVPVNNRIITMYIVNPHEYSYVEWMQFLHKKYYYDSKYPIVPIETRSGSLMYDGLVFMYKDRRNTIYTIPERPLLYHLEKIISRARDAGFEFKWNTNHTNNSCVK